MNLYDKKMPELNVAWLYIVLLPFLQLGISYYLSVQMFLFIALVAQLYFIDFKRNAIWALMLIMLMILPSLFYGADEKLHMVLGVSRQFVCLLVLLAVLSHSDFFKRDFGNLEAKIVGLMWLFFIVVTIQYIGLKLGYAWHIPSNYFISNQNTVIGFEKAVGLGLHADVRPSASYGEPSYLSFICFSLVFIAYSVFISKKNIVIVTLLAFAIVLQANSLSGALALFALLLVRLVSKMKLEERVMVPVIGVLVATAIVVLFNHLPIIQRILGILGMGNGVDISSNIRFFAPFLIISEVFTDHPFGLPKEVLMPLIESKFEEGFKGTDNGLLNIFINFGYLGFAIVGIILYKLKTNVLLISFVLLSAMFNGAFFSYDKIAVIGFSVLLASSLSNRAYVFSGYASEVEIKEISDA